jgi:hypothetical protein
MRRWMPVLVILFTMGVSGAAGSQDKKPEQLQQVKKPIRELSWLEGGVWVADATKLGPGMKSIETRYEWSDNGAYLRFTTHFVFEKGTAKTYDGEFFWDPEKKSLAVWYMDAGGAITQGPVDCSGDLMRITFRGPDFDGKIGDLKVEVTRKSNEQYHWMVSEKDGENWKELAALDYFRGSGGAGRSSETIDQGRKSIAAR